MYGQPVRAARTRERTRVLIFFRNFFAQNLTFLEFSGATDPLPHAHTKYPPKYRPLGASVATDQNFTLNVRTNRTQ